MIRVYNIGTKVIVTGDGGGLSGVITDYVLDKYIVTFDNKSTPNTILWNKEELRPLKPDTITRKEHKNK